MLTLAFLCYLLYISISMQSVFTVPMIRGRILRFNRFITRRGMCVVGDASIYNIAVNEEHEKVAETTLKHCTHLAKYIMHNSIAPHTANAFKEADIFINKFYGNSRNKIVILDSGCGKGLSTISLAAKFPNIPVIGIDRSFHRLSHNRLYRNAIEEDNDNDDEGDSAIDNNSQVSQKVDDQQNVLFVRAELSDFWLLASQSDWIIHSHYLLYPNPYPKSKHLGRRWHCHPSFPFIIALGGTLVVRSNWDIYCREMLSALKAIVNAKAFPNVTANINDVSEYQPAMDGVNKYLTHFERKYILAGVKVYELKVDLGARERPERLAMLHLSE